MLIIGAALGVGAVGAAFAADAADPVDGSWTLNVAKSKFSPGPAPQSQTRTYATTDQGVALSFTGVAADGTQTSGQSNYKYDGKDYPISGSPDFDTLAVTRIDANTAKSTQKKAGKVVGTTIRKVSKNGKHLRLRSNGTNAAGSRYSNVMVFDKQ
jgi:opacity protein-like surface antigen